MRGLTVIASAPDGERMRTGLTLAAATAALGGRARLFVHDAAVRLLADLAAPGDAAHVAAGLPALAALFEEALGLGVEVIACQSGLHLAGIAAGTLDARIGYGGPIGILQTLGADRLLTA